MTGSWGEHKHLSVCVCVNSVFRSIGPTDLTLGTVSYPLNASTIPTVTDRLFAQGSIQQNLVAVSFEPTTSVSVVNGELTFGATDPTKYIGDINYS
jgi:cathepsin E